MMKVKKYIKEMYSLLEEINLAKSNFKTVMTEVNAIDLQYQKGEIEYKEYSRIKSRILSKKGASQVIQNYRLYADSLKNRLAETNARIIKIIYDDTSYEKLESGRFEEKKAGLNLPQLDALEIAESEPIENLEVEEKKRPFIPTEPDIAAPSPEPMESLNAPDPAKMGFFKRLGYAIQAREKPWETENNVAFGGLFSAAFLKYLFFGEQKKRGIFGESKILPSILSYEEQGNVDKELEISKSDILDPYMLEKQIKELKSLISKKKPDVYKASSLGYIANVTVRKISIYFIEKYPEFFKKLYRAVRYSNIRILANTYINIIFFLTIVSGLVSLPLFTVFFSFQGGPAHIVIFKIIATSFTIANLFFWGGYYYPFMNSKSRRRSINTKLPFAIDHMSSVISSGVSPATMFKLISNSSEYGEISIEIEKVTNYVDFFGYDIITALKAVALTTPSEEFKEFIDGFVSTIETGGDLKDFLSQKSSEALLNYRLERQKYVESLSTYSDIYTGVLIAAPLFFVTALSLVSVLGGTIGGLSVNTIITLGTYIVIPGLNLLFLVFLELNQPEI